MLLPEVKDSMQYMYEQFAKESDRASVILVAAVIDEYLRTVLKAKLVEVSDRDDPLFSGINAPMGPFGSRINCAYRLGLISKNMCDSLHIVRHIRNDFAHDVFGCSFGNQSVKDRISNLRESFGPIADNMQEAFAVVAKENSAFADLMRGPIERQSFFVCATMILVALHLQSRAQTQSINEAEKEWCYRQTSQSGGPSAPAQQE